MNLDLKPGDKPTQIEEQKWHPLLSSKHAARIAKGLERANWYEPLESCKMTIFESIVGELCAFGSEYFYSEEFVSMMCHFNPFLTREEIVMTMELIKEQESEHVDFGKFLYFLACYDPVTKEWLTSVTSARESIILSAIITYFEIYENYNISMEKSSHTSERSGTTDTGSGEWHPLFSSPYAAAIAKGLVRESWYKRPEPEKMVVLEEIVKKLCRSGKDYFLSNEFTTMVNFFNPYVIEDEINIIRKIVYEMDYDVDFGKFLYYLACYDPYSERWLESPQSPKESLILSAVATYFDDYEKEMERFSNFLEGSGETKAPCTNGKPSKMDGHKNEIPKMPKIEINYPQILASRIPLSYIKIPAEIQEWKRGNWNKGDHNYLTQRANEAQLEQDMKIQEITVAIGEKITKTVARRMTAGRERFKHTHAIYFPSSGKHVPKVTTWMNHWIFGRKVKN